MSRVGKLPIALLQGVEVTVGEHIAVKGPQATLSLKLNSLVAVRVEGSTVLVDATNDSSEANAMRGTFRALINNMVTGVSKGFEKKLNLVGVGYRAQAQGENLNLQVGYSHPVAKVMPKGVKVETPTPTEIVLKGADLQVIGQVAAEIRAFRPPEPYKGKGIRYANERVVIKETKKK